MCLRSLFAFVMPILLLSGCSAPRGDSATFQKAEGYPCLNEVIEQEYLVRFRDGSYTVIHAENDEDFLKNYFEVHRDEIQIAEPNYRLSVNQNQISVAQGPGYDNWGAAAIRADHFWAQNLRGENIVVAVVDTGVDLSHPQLKNQIYQNSGEMGLDANGQDKRFNGLDDDGNGYADDWRGYDFYNDMPLMSDNSNHGTHVAGIIAAEHQDSVAGSANHVQGIAPKAKILPAAFMGPTGSGSIDGALAAIHYSARQGAQIINASWGGSGCSATLRQEVRALAEKNVLFVAAAGNNGRDLNTFPEYPASFEGLTQITVGSIDENLKMSEFSNFSSRFVHLFAPGGAITSSVPGEQYATFDGTSMASPFVAGAAALLWSQNPQLSALEVRDRLMRMVRHSGSYINQTQGALVLQSQ